MPDLIPHAIPAGTLAAHPQPAIPAEGGLTLRPWEPADAPLVHRAFQDPVLHLWHAKSSGSEAEAASWIEEWTASWRDERHAFWAVADARSHTLVGRVALRDISLEDGLAEIAYWTMPTARGQGVAPRAVVALSTWALDTIGLHRLELTHSTGNDASCRVATKTGYALEGTKRSASLHPDGWHDMHLHARVQGDPLP